MKYVRKTAAEMKYMIKTAAEMKYVSKTVGYSFTDYKTNKQIAKVLNITPVLYKM
jgi:hypothetical protein